jgi:hypothetical protein
MEFSPLAWIGALIGAITAVAIYIPAIPVISRHMRAEANPQTAAERAAFAEKLSVARRLILAADIAVLATAGYWIGKIIGMKWAG